jgi:translation initiation factor 2B subunit (eIF-2B alpha/beta/delta family)
MAQKQLTHRIESLRKDHVSGSFDLTIKACKILSVYLQGTLNRECDSFISDLRQLGSRIIRMQPEAASIYNIVNRIIYYIERGCKKYLYPDGVREYGLTLLSDEIEHLERSRVRIGELGSSLLQKKYNILTLSLSETVKEIFTIARSKGFDFHVTIMESRPLREGCRMASALCRQGIHVTLIADASFLKFLPEIDMILVGADRIKNDGLTNKIGTGALAVVSRHFSKPLYAACETIKILPDGVSLTPEKEHPASELWNRRMKNLTIANYYYDVVPLEYFTGFITERGVLRIGGIKKIQNEASRMKVITLQ